MWPSSEMILDEGHVLGFLNFMFSMQIKNLAQPLSCYKNNVDFDKKMVVFATLPFFTGLL